MHRRPGDPTPTSPRSVRSRRTALALAVALPALAYLSGCALFQHPPAASPAPPSQAPPSLATAHEILVVATAYNSLPAQTKQRDPALSASGVRLRSGMRVVAVSDDLFEQGLRFGTRVWIEGMAGTWRVADRMAPRWRRRIDVYMGRDRAAALRFGERRVRIRWEPPD